MIILWALLWYLMFNIFVWFLLFDEYDSLVHGFQQTNFSAHERVRLAVLLPGLPLVLILVVAFNAREWRRSGVIVRNFAKSSEAHWAIIIDGSKPDYEKDAT